MQSDCCASLSNTNGSRYNVVSLGLYVVKILTNTDVLNCVTTAVSMLIRLSQREGVISIRLENDDENDDDLILCHLFLLSDTR